MENEMKYHIEKNTVQETLIIPLFGRLVCSERFPQLFSAMASRFPGAVLTFDACNRRGAKLMRKTWLKEAGITDVGAYFSLENENELKVWSDRFASVTAKSYMRGYRDIYRDVGAFHKLMLRFCDGTVQMKIVTIIFQS